MENNKTQKILVIYRIKALPFTNYIKVKRIVTIDESRNILVGMYFSLSEAKNKIKSDFNRNFSKNTYKYEIRISNSELNKMSYFVKDISKSKLIRKDE